MNFQNIPKVEKYDFYLDVAFRRAKEAAEKAGTKVRGSGLRRASVIEAERIKKAAEILHRHLQSILKSFPMVEELPEFYRELIRCCVDVDRLRKSLGGVLWADGQVKRFFRIYYGKLRNSKDLESLFKHKRGFYGRVSSTIKQIKNELAYLDEGRRIMRRMPDVKTDIPTIVIAGFPNVGKTTLLRALTGSEPEIASYPFTTKGLMLGYAGQNGTKIQVIDTPGLLDRPLAQRNRIELQAVLALKHLANKVVFMIDPTETCGYEMEEQLALLKDIKETFNQEITVAINKTDLATPEQIANAKEKLKKYRSIEISADKNKGTKELW
ncbi:50S ribosome-binding GTPase [Candidatus Woesearchaeota archaeon]|nr:50S ribosome-binding GTPase [Candidatus Woesearchaeota archaeon]